jgi:sugar phosphate isomerase/epimerase
MKKIDRRFLFKMCLGMSGGMVFGEKASKADSLLSPSSGGSEVFKLGLVTYNLAKDWDIPTLIRNCRETGFEAVELRTTHRHGVELSLSQTQRRDVKQQFSASPVRLLSLGSTCEFHSADTAVVHKNIEETKRFLQLARDVGALGVKVRPNGLPSGVPEEKTLDQIGRALAQCGETARDLGTEVWLEVHGEQTCFPQRIAKIMQSANHPQVGICWNSNPQDVEAGSVRSNFQLLKPWLKNAHINELWNADYPWKELFRLFREAEYRRYTLAEIPESSDPIRLMHYYRALWTELVAGG